MARTVQSKPFLLWMDVTTKDLLQQIREKTRLSMTAAVLFLIEEKAEELGIRARVIGKARVKRVYRCRK